MYSSDNDKWDFRTDEEIEFSKLYEDKGFLVCPGNKDAIDQIHQIVQASVECFLSSRNIDYKRPLLLNRVHDYLEPNLVNDIRLHVLNTLSADCSPNRLYYYSAKKFIDALCCNELVMQRRISLSAQYPNNYDDILPIHADTWNGVSPYDLNVWIPLTDCYGSMCLYLLERPKLHLINGLSDHSITSDAIFDRLKDHMTWINIRYGDILIFDQSLPHGYSLNIEDDMQWSMNCRFKNAFSPYVDKLVGEYFVPITLRSSARIGLRYEDPTWLLE